MVMKAPLLCQELQDTPVSERWRQYIKHFLIVLRYSVTPQSNQPHMDSGSNVDYNFSHVILSSFTFWSISTIETMPNHLLAGAVCDVSLDL